MCLMWNGREETIPAWGSAITKPPRFTASLRGGASMIFLGISVNIYARFPDVKYTEQQENHPQKGGFPAVLGERIHEKIL